MPILIGLYFHHHGVRVRRDDFEALVSLCRPLYWPGNVRQLYKALDAARFKAAVAHEHRFAPYFTVTESMQGPFMAAGEAVTGSSIRAGAINDLVKEILKIQSRPIDLQQLLETVESSLIRYSLNNKCSLNEVMDHLNLSRGKLDFQRRKYKLMNTPHMLEKTA